MLQALNRAFGDEADAAPCDTAWLTQALADSGPPTVVRGRDGVIHFANATFTELS